MFLLWIHNHPETLRMSHGNVGGPTHTKSLSYSFSMICLLVIRKNPHDPSLPTIQKLLPVF